MVQCLLSSILFCDSFPYLLLWHRIHLFICISVAEHKGISDNIAAHLVSDINTNKNIFFNKHRVGAEQH